MHELYFAGGGFAAGAILVWLYRGAMTAEIDKLRTDLSSLLSKK